jgi:hypothetical protein
MCNGGTDGPPIFGCVIVDGPAPIQDHVRVCCQELTCTPVFPTGVGKSGNEDKDYCDFSEKIWSCPVDSAGIVLANPPGKCKVTHQLAGEGNFCCADLIGGLFGVSFFGHRRT